MVASSEARQHTTAGPRWLTRQADSLVQRLGAPQGRIVPVAGDLSKPALGIEGFSEPIDHFFHLAAVYDMTADEEAMERANIEGTRHVVEFANSIEVGRFHHTSSIAVSGRYRGLFREDMFDEGSPPPRLQPHQYEYGLVRGLKAKVLVFARPRRGPSETGERTRSTGTKLLQALQKLRRARPSGVPLAGRRRRTTSFPGELGQGEDHIAQLPTRAAERHLPPVDPSHEGARRSTSRKSAHAPQFASRIDPNMTNAIPKPVRAGVMALPTVKKIRGQVYGDLGIPPAAMENRDFRCKFDARDSQRALSGTGIAVPPLSTYAPRLWDYWERNLDPDRSATLAGPTRQGPRS